MFLITHITQDALLAVCLAKNEIGNLIFIDSCQTILLDEDNLNAFLEAFTDKCVQTVFNLYKCCIKYIIYDSHHSSLQYNGLINDIKYVRIKCFKDLGFRFKTLTAK